MKIAVIGGSGFLGNNLIKHLSALQRYSIINVDLKEPVKSYKSDFIKSALGSQKEVSKVFKRICAGKAEKMVIFHFAGIADRSICDRFPEKAVFTNVTLTSFLLQVCNDFNVARFIFPSSGLIYAQHYSVPIKEEDKCEATSVYTAVKIAAENIIKGCSTISATKYFIARIANVYGPESGVNTVFGKIVQQAMQAKRDISLLQLMAKTDFIYIKDVASFFERTISVPVDSIFNTYNVSSNQSYSPLVVARKVCKEINLLQTRIIPELLEQKRSNRILSNKKARRELGWFPKFSIDEGIKDSIRALTLCKREK